MAADEHLRGRLSPVECRDAATSGWSLRAINYVTDKMMTERKPFGGQGQGAVATTRRDLESGRHHLGSQTRGATALPCTGAIVLVHETTRATDDACTKP